jgi:quercetin dioxygenase-like cupin family protein
MRPILTAAGAILLGLFAGVPASPAIPQDGQAPPVFITPADVAWKEAPPSLPKGAHVALLDGNPKESGIFAMRLKLPPDYKIPPHFHPVEERLTVISGTFHVGLGDSFDASKTKELKAGSFMKIPAKTHHFACVKEETVVQLNSMGPWDLQYVNPADDPRKK